MPADTPTPRREVSPDTIGAVLDTVRANRALGELWHMSDNALAALIEAVLAAADELPAPVAMSEAARLDALARELVPSLPAEWQFDEDTDTGGEDWLDELTHPGAPYDEHEE